MLALAGVPLGVQTQILEPSHQAPARLAALHLAADYTDQEALETLAQCDVVTLEFENVPVQALTYLNGQVPVRPAPEILERSRHRVREKQALQALGLETAPFWPLHDVQQAEEALLAVGGEGILKTAELGYDGKGQHRVRSAGELRQALADLNAECVLEGVVPFVREVSLAVARNPAGELAFGGLIENEHQGGILRRSVFPAASSADTARRAREMAATAAQAWQLEGLLTFEFFELEGGKLLVNEIAPRVHNSGHLTQNGGGISQFEAQLRAVLDLPLQDFAPLRPCAMVNLLGWSAKAPDWQALLREEGAHLHLYHKDNVPGRKLGHVNVVGDTRELVLQRAARIEALLGTE
nr:5-(carboxyamino)imidazole ribonucleotide synthase [Deinococcus peraridilitoris]